MTPARTAPSGRARRNDAWIALPSGDNDFDREIRKGALLYAKEHGIANVRLCDEEDLLTILRETPEAFRSRSLAILGHLRPKELQSAVRRNRIPLVMLGQEDVPGWRRHLGGQCTICSVDNEAIGALAATYFSVQHRFASYVFADGRRTPGWSWWSQRRNAGFVQTLKDDDPRAVIRTCDFLNHAPETDARSFAATLRPLPKPVAVFACNDQIAREVISACVRANLAVPGDIAVLGVDDNASLCLTSPVALSSIRIDHVRLGRLAMALLVKNLRGAEIRDRTILCPPLRVVERASTARQRTTGEAVGGALGFLASADPNALTSKALAKAAGVSPSRLMHLFPKETGVTVFQAILTRKLDLVRERLLDSDAKIADLADQCGFKSSAVLCALFKRRYGQTMSAFRRTRDALA